MSGKVGGTSDVRDANQEIQDLVNQVQGSLEEKSGKKFAHFDAIQYKSQIVAGTNYFVKVQVSDSDFVHLRIFRPLPQVNGVPQLADYQEGKTADSEIEYF